MHPSPTITYNQIISIKNKGGVGGGARNSKHDYSEVNNDVDHF